MAALFYINIFAVFSSFPLVIHTSQNSRAPVEIDHGATDGELFIKKLIHGKKIKNTPGFLMFTAPYRLHEGYKKSDNDNFVIAFPIYIGKNGKEMYRNLYHRDFHLIHSKKTNAPFRKRTTRPPSTDCPTEKTTTTSTELPVTITTMLLTTSTTELLTTTTETLPTITESPETTGTTPDLPSNEILKMTLSTWCPRIPTKVCKKTHVENGVTSTYYVKVSDSMDKRIPNYSAVFGENFDRNSMYLE